MDIEEIPRPLNRAELAVLKKLKKEIERALSRKFRVRAFIIAILSGALSAYIAVLIDGGFFSFVFGTAAVLCFSFVVFAPYELYKSYKKLTAQLEEVTAFLDKKQVKVTPVHALQIALGEEYEDEGELFIIEYKPGHILYLWNYDYGLGAKFPCLEFEIYEERFFRLINRQVYTISEKIKPVVINRKNKWAYMGQIGAHKNLSTEQIEFNTLVDRYNTIIPVTKK